MHMHNHKFEKNSSPRSSVLSKSVGMLILFSRLEPTRERARDSEALPSYTNSRDGGRVKTQAKAVPLEALKGATSKNESRWDNAYLGKHFVPFVLIPPPRKAAADSSIL